MEDFAKIWKIFTIPKICFGRNVVTFGIFERLPKLQQKSHLKYSEKCSKMIPKQTKTFMELFLKTIRLQKPQLLTTKQ